MKYIITLSLVFSLTLFTTISKAQMRLMGKAHRTYVSSGNIIEDSVLYFHSGVKGANPGKYKIPEFELMEDSMHVFTKDGTGVKWTGRRVSTYNGSDFNESIYYTWNDSSKTWRNSLRTRILYKSGKPDTVHYETWSTFGSGSWRRSSCIVYTWNSNNIATRHRLTYSYGGGGNPAGWRNNRMHTYQYSGNNETSFVDQRWVTSGGGSWQDSVKRETTYAAGKVSQINWFKSSGGSWTDDVRYIYSYDGNSRITVIQKDIYTGVWENDNGRDTFFYTGSSATPDTMIRIAKLFPPNFTNQGKWGYKYLPDGSGRMTEEVSISWDGISEWKQTNNQDSINNWYYNWVVSVESIDVNNSKINIYPSPANNTIHVQLDGIMKDKHVQYVILDMQGRVVKNWSEYSKSETKMSVNELPSGNYILNVNDGTFKGVRKFTISR
ncbi:MAG: T9SS type A sorting domain-containing protein [Taibaiella sp.]|nr:T9SS type A sorting domain-containing protein [Taibaiella sp.]